MLFVERNFTQIKLLEKITLQITQNNYLLNIYLCIYLFVHILRHTIENYMKLK